MQVTDEDTTFQIQLGTRLIKNPKPLLMGFHALTAPPKGDGDLMKT